MTTEEIKEKIVNFGASALQTYEVVTLDKIKDWYTVEYMSAASLLRDIFGIEFDKALDMLYERADEMEKEVEEKAFKKAEEVCGL